MDPTTYRQERNIKIYLKEKGGENTEWINLAVVQAVTRFRGPKNDGKFTDLLRND